ncbi:uncharacterized protein VTP21DRAFT_9504 [Calcarisporiella thermophila]|uniref:uncharacterized protein n=1 Tax=Calcarisporiella thermophila TaxID=911321 RepID=UPI003743241A
MSLFGNPFGGANQQQQVNQANLMAAEQELEMITDLFNRIVDSCFKKCIPPKYHEAELNKGESVCVDRCVAKFFAANIKVGEKMQQMSQTNAGGR